MRGSAGRNMRDNWFFCHQRFKEWGPQAKSEIESTKTVRCSWPKTVVLPQVGFGCCLSGVRSLSCSVPHDPSQQFCVSIEMRCTKIPRLFCWAFPRARPIGSRSQTKLQKRQFNRLTHISSFRALPTSERLTVYFSVPVRAGKLLLPREMVVSTRIQLRPMRSL